MDRLLRALAPVSDAAWQEIEKEARQTLKRMLGARRLIDFRGPQGWAASAESAGRIDSIAAPRKGEVEAGLRRVHPFVEFKAPFELARSEIEAIDRGAKDPDMGPVIAAAREIALAEDSAVFLGYKDAAIRGICNVDADSALTLDDDYTAYPAMVATALSRLRNAGVDGPYAIALGKRCYTGLTETTEGGYPVIEHVRRLLDGPVVWAPALHGAVVLSMRGGDFELIVGEDFSIGYASHNTEKVRLYIQESMTFRVLSPQAAVPLNYRSREENESHPPKRARDPKV
jgi:uncharacterized linocin/CFP29 family protein